MIESIRTFRINEHISQRCLKQGFAKTHPKRPCTVSRLVVTECKGDYPRPVGRLCRFRGEVNTKRSNICPCTFEIALHRSSLIPDGLQQLGLHEAKRNTPPQSHRIVPKRFLCFIQKADLIMLAQDTVILKNGI